MSYYAFGDMQAAQRPTISPSMLPWTEFVWVVKPVIGYWRIKPGHESDAVAYVNKYVVTHRYQAPGHYYEGWALEQSDQSKRLWDEVQKKASTGWVPGLYFAPMAIEWAAGSAVSTHLGGRGIILADGNGALGLAILRFKRQYQQRHGGQS
jgi:hypothetical protein